MPLINKKREIKYNISCLARNTVTCSKHHRKKVMNVTMFKFLKVKGFMKSVIVCTFCVLSITAKAAGIVEYMQGYAKTGQANFKKEQELLEGARLKGLVRELSPFYSDTLARVRQKAYYLTYKKGTHEKTGGPEQAIYKLLDGCKDKNGGIIGQNIGYLKQFNKKHYDKGAVEKIEKLLARHRTPHYKEIILLAGFAGAGKEYFKRKLLEQEIADDIKWHMSLALARLGDQERAGFCLGQIKKQPVNDVAMAYVLPYAIYTRQKEATDYCIETLKEDKKLCHSLDPDNPAKTLCGYRAMELLAPVIEGFPLKLDSTGSIDTTDYRKALETARKWLSENPGYKLRTDIY